MFPPSTLLTSMLTGLVAKLGFTQLQKRGYMPQSIYVTRALKALQKDDLDEAIRNYRLAVARQQSTKTDIAYEIISNAISLRIGKLQTRIDELEKILKPPLASRRFWRNLLPRQRLGLASLQEEQSGCEEAITVLNSIQDQLENSQVSGARQGPLDFLIRKNQQSGQR